MIVDLTGYDGPEEISCDLCIAGSGAAGLAIAAEFLDKPTKVLVLEGGGLEFSGESQELYVGQSVGMPYQDLDVARLRYFGGSTKVSTARRGRLLRVELGIDDLQHGRGALEVGVEIGNPDRPPAMGHPRPPLEVERLQRLAHAFPVISLRPGADRHAAVGAEPAGSPG